MLRNPKIFLFFTYSACNFIEIYNFYFRRKNITYNLKYKTAIYMYIPNFILMFTDSKM